MNELNNETRRRRYLCRDDATAIPRALLERPTFGRLRWQHCESGFNREESLAATRQFGGYELARQFTPFRSIWRSVVGPQCLINDPDRVETLRRVAFDVIRSRRAVAIFGRPHDKSPAPRGCEVTGGSRPPSFTPL
jgi:hypothetical protein